MLTSNRLRLTAQKGLFAVPGWSDTLQSPVRTAKFPTVSSLIMTDGVSSWQSVFMRLQALDRYRFERNRHPCKGGALPLPATMRMRSSRLG